MQRHFVMISRVEESAGQPLNGGVRTGADAGETCSALKVVEMIRPAARATVGILRKIYALESAVINIHASLCEIGNVQVELSVKRTRRSGSCRPIRRRDSEYFPEWE